MHPLHPHFQQAEQDCQSYLALLDQERDALTGQDIGNLEQILDAKRPYAEQLIRHDQQIKSYCQQNQLQLGELADHITAQQDPALSAAYQAFITALSACQQANDRNARLVRHSQHATRSLLDLLRNQGEPSAGVYDQLGNASRSGQTRDLTKA
jgi:flagella synthesis protein FlgN